MQEHSTTEEEKHAGALHNRRGKTCRIALLRNWK
jgi:hypothetical protein